MKNIIKNISKKLIAIELGRRNKGLKIFFRFWNPGVDIGIFFFTFLIYVLTDIAQNLNISIEHMLLYIIYYSVRIPIEIIYIRYFLFFFSMLIQPFIPCILSLAGNTSFYDLPLILQNFLALLLAVLLLINEYV